MEPLTAQIIAGVVLITLTTTIALVRYFLKKRLEKIDTIEEDVTLLQNHFSSLKEQFHYLEEKLNMIENTNFPLLMEIKNSMSEVHKKLSVVETEIMYLKKYSDKHSNRLDSIDYMYHLHKRKDDN